MNLFRLHIRPRGGGASPEDSFSYCLRKQVLGVGWQAGDKSTSVWEEYEKAAKRDERAGFGTPSGVRFLHDRVKKDDLIWTRCPAGNYHLGKVLSGWEYLTSPAAGKADIVNVVRCRILAVPQIDQVPGKVVACFRAMRTLQSIRDEGVLHYSAHLWNQISGSSDYPPWAPGSRDLFSFLGADETEDVVFLYLQVQGWLVIPHSRKADTMGFEFFCIHRRTGEKAVVQVKTGETPLPPSEWAQQNEKVFLFQAKGHYPGPSETGVVTLSPKLMIKFLKDHRDILPKTILYWLDLTHPT